VFQRFGGKWYLRVQSGWIRLTWMPKPSGLIDLHEDGGCTFLRNVGTYRYYRRCNNPELLAYQK